MPYAEYKVIAINPDGTPQCVCPACGQKQRVQVQQLRRKLYQVDCVNPACLNHLHTAYIRQDDLADVVK